jgi:voltage-gated potassium channel Kch
MSEAGQPGSERRKLPWRERLGDWLSEGALSVLLLLLALDMFVLPVVGPNVGTVAINVVFTVMLFTGLAAVSNRGVASVVVGVLALAAATLKWIAPHPALPGAHATAAGAGVVVFGLFTLLVLLRTLSPGPITRRRIEGAIAAYLLIAMTFALAFELVELTWPGSIHFNGGPPELLSAGMSYFSLVTLTTVGYGDVTPVTSLARQLAMFEGLIGQMYPAIIIGWMVSSMKWRHD